MPEDADVYHDILAFYWLGLHEPLRFFPRSSYTYAEKVSQDKASRATTAAHQQWQGSLFSRREGEDRYFTLAMKPR